ncbi:hypothetical protein J7L48_05175 [bacterium]|nr:hypothetical protein [bacterium]
MKKLFILITFFFLVKIIAVDFDWGYVKFFNQLQYTLSEENVNSFSLKRSRVIAGGDIIQNIVSLKVQLEFAAIDSNAKVNILDVKGIYKHKDLTLILGRFLVPFDYYTPHSSADLNTLDYPLLDSEYSPWRQEGVLLKYKSTLLNFDIGGFNGGEKNSFSDTDSEKAVIAHISFEPMEGLNFNISGYHNNYQSGTQWIKQNSIISYFYMKEKNLFSLIQVQYNEDDELNTDGDIFSLGYFIHFSFYMNNVEILARYEFLDKDLNVNGNVITRLTTGISYNIKGVGTKISVNYQKNGETVEIPNDKLIFQFQFLL